MLFSCSFFVSLIRVSVTCQLAWCRVETASLRDILSVAADTLHYVATRQGGGFQFAKAFGSRSKAGEGGGVLSTDVKCGLG